MRVHLAHVAIVTVLFSSSLRAQQPHYFTPIAGAGQSLHGQIAANDGAFGVIALKSADGFTVTEIVPGSPVDKSAIKKGDVIKRVNGKATADLSQVDFYNELTKKPGESLQFVLAKAGQDLAVDLMAESRSKLYPQEAQMPPAVSQLILDGHAGITAVLAQDNAQRVFLRLAVFNPAVPSLKLDDAKFFVLDGQRQQLHHVTLPEIQYSIETSVAQNMHSGSYTPPPPPSSQRQYVITGSENGNYTLNNLGGGMATMSGTSTSSYTVTPQPDYNQLGYSLGLAIRQMRDRKHDKKLVQEAQQALSQWNGVYLKTDSPLIQGENRNGVITYWSAQGVRGPFRVVLFVTDPATGKDQAVTFNFQ
jgi:hypothetical protein